MQVEGYLSFMFCYFFISKIVVSLWIINRNDTMIQKMNYFSQGNILIIYILVHNTFFIIVSISLISIWMNYDYHKL